MLLKNLCSTKKQITMTVDDYIYLINYFGIISSVLILFACSLEIIVKFIKRKIK